MEVLASTFLLGALVMVPVAAWLGLGWVGSGPGLAVVLYLGLATMGVANILFTRGLGGLPAGAAVTLTLADPLTATVLGAWLLDQRLTAGGWVGLAVRLPRPGAAGCLVLASVLTTRALATSCVSGVRHPAPLARRAPDGRWVVRVRGAASGTFARRGSGRGRLGEPTSDLIHEGVCLQAQAQHRQPQDSASGEDDLVLAQGIGHRVEGKRVVPAIDLDDEFSAAPADIEIDATVLEFHHDLSVRGGQAPPPAEEREVQLPE
jgi:Integral membrane protein DUF6.